MYIAPMVDILTSLSGKWVGMNGEDYVFIPDGSVVSEELINEAKKQRLKQAKEQKLKELSQKLKDEIQEKAGGLEVSGVGVVDCGRAHLENVSNLISYLQSSGVDNVAFRMHDNTAKNLSLEQLKTIKVALIEAGLSLYAKKWQMEALINEASSIKELENITWDEAPASEADATATVATAEESAATATETGSAPAAPATAEGTGTTDAADLNPAD